VVVVLAAPVKSWEVAVQQRVRAQLAWLQGPAEPVVVLREVVAVHELLCRMLRQAMHARLHVHDARDPGVPRIHASTCEVPNHLA
jgi:hypothetical protein